MRILPRPLFAAAAALLLLLPSVALCDGGSDSAVGAGDVVFVRPTADDSFAAGEKFTVRWRNDEDQASRELRKREDSGEKYTLELCTGSNSDITPLGTITKEETLRGGEGETEAVVDGGIGEDGCVYFLRMTVTTPDSDEPSTFYSPRFSMKSMTGTFAPAIRSANNAAVNKNPPPPRVPLAKRQLAAPVNPGGAAQKPAAAPAAGDQFAVPYTLQTGPVRFAPMQPQPGTSITAKGQKMLHPTSSVVIFTVAAQPAKQRTTETQPPNWKQKSVVNQASPAPNPADGMAKYLRRWADDNED